MKVAVFGSRGRMGAEVCRAVEAADDLTLVAAVDVGDDRAPVEAADIRTGAGLVLAGLVGQGATTVYEIHHIERGYAGFVPSLRGLGADVEAVEMPSPFDS